jgi:hypothetical protein
VEVYGLNALLPVGPVRGVQRWTPPERVAALLRERLGHELRVEVLRRDPDRGTVFVSEQAPASQLLLPFN